MTLGERTSDRGINMILKRMLARRYDRTVDCFRIAWQVSPRAVSLLGICIFVASFVPIMSIWVTRYLIDAVVAIVHGESMSVGPWIAVQTVLFLAFALGREGGDLAKNLLATGLHGFVSGQVLEKALIAEPAELEGEAVESAIRELRRDGGRRLLLVVEQTITLVSAGLVLLGYLWILKGFSWYVVGALVGVAIPPLYAELKFAAQNSKILLRRSTAARELSNVEEMLSGAKYLKELRVFAAIDYLKERHRGMSESLFGQAKHQALREGAFKTAFSMASTAIYGSCYGWIVVSAVRGSCSIGQMTAYLAAIRRAKVTVDTVVYAYALTHENSTVASDYNRVMSMTTRSRRHGTAIPGGADHIGLECIGVGFQYPGQQRWAVRNVSLSIPRSGLTVILGPNGSGKSTLLKLFLRQLTPIEGEVRLNNRSITEWEEEAYYSCFSVKHQEFCRYNFTCRENVAISDVSQIGNDALLAQVSSMTGADAVVARLPRGFDTVLGRPGDNGMGLSGGEWQRIALARAFFRTTASILLLDEPTASLDMDAEDNFLRLLRQSVGNRCVVLVTHRYGIAKHADHIVVMDQGAVVEQGTYAALSAARGPYSARLVKQRRSQVRYE